MAVMALKYRMINFEIYIAKDKKLELENVTAQVGKFVSSIRIRHGISGGSSLTKRNIHSSPYEISNSHSRVRRKVDTSPSELDMQVTENSYLEDLFGPGVIIEIKFASQFGEMESVFKGIIKQFPYGGAKDMVNFNVRAYSYDIDLSSTSKNRTFKAAPLTRSALLAELIGSLGFKLKFRHDNDSLVRPSEITQKNVTDMELLEYLADKWNADIYLLENEVVWCKKGTAYEFGDFDNPKSIGAYPLGYRTDKINCNVESVDWVQESSPGGSSTMPSIITYNEKGEKVLKHKFVYRGETYRLKPPLREMLKTDPLGFRKFTMHNAGLTAINQNDDAIKTYFEVDPTSDPSKIDSSVPAGGDQSGIELTIMLNEGDVLLRAPRSAVLYAGGDLDVQLNTNLPQWLFQFSSPELGMNAAKLNIKESVLTFEQGILKSELKCSIRTTV